MWKKILLTLVGVVLVVGAIVYAKLGQFAAMGEAAANMQPPPEVVTAMVVGEDQWEQSFSAVGSLTAVQGVTISAEVPGRVKTIAFESGATVTAGDVLVELDTAGETADLRSAEAAAALANANLKRSRELSKRQLVSPAEVDTARAQAREAIAQVQMKRSNLALKTIAAPFDGRLGLRQINVGQVVSSSDPIVTLQTLDPIYVTFAIPQQRLNQIAVDMPVRLRTDAVKDDVFEGTVSAISPEVDPVTRNATVRAVIRNPSGQLTPGMFAEVDAILPDVLPVLAIASSSVQYAPFGNSVFVIEEKEGESGEKSLSLRQQFVRLGQTRGDFVSVLDGLKAGEQIVTSGAFKLRSGMTVRIDNALAPKPSINPSPSNS
ncbi:MAG: efflux RND transporter periplasmic adaptor subunit [Burkholderiaceae bacterium]